MFIHTSWVAQLGYFHTSVSIISYGYITITTSTGFSISIPARPASELLSRFQTNRLWRRRNGVWTAQRRARASGARQGHRACSLRMEGEMEIEGHSATENELFRPVGLLGG